MKIKLLKIAVLGFAVFFAGVAFGKHKAVTLKDVTRDLDSAENNLNFVQQHLPPGTLVGVQLSMAEQSIQRAKQHLMEYAEQQKDQEPKAENPK